TFQAYNGNVTLGADTNVGSLNGTGNITFTGSLQSSGAARNLTASTGGITTFGGAVGGGGNPLANLTTNGGGTTQINGGSVNTTGFVQTWDDDVTLGAAFTILAGIVNVNAGLVLGNTATTATSTLQIAGTLNFAATTTVT